MIPAAPREFYRVRDDRTTMFVQTSDFQESAIVTMSTDLVKGKLGASMLSVACALLARWCRSVTIDVPLLSVADREAVLTQMRAADPFGEFHVEPVDRPGLHLHIGSGIKPACDRAVSIGSRGWLAALSYGDAPPALSSRVDGVLGGIAAACLGVSQLFKMALRMPREAWLEEGVIDMFALARLPGATSRRSSEPPESHDVGRVLMVGAGSVGSSALYCARLAGIRGRVTVVDFDEVELENVPRSLVFDCPSVGRSKVEVMADCIAGSGLSIEPVRSTWNEFVRAGGLAGVPFDVWLPLANEDNARWSIQNNHPPTMVQASTAKNWGVNFGRHLPGVDDCLACRFPDSEVAQGLICSDGRIEVNSTRVDASLPFLSLFAGLLVVCELVRGRLRSAEGGPNYAFFDFGGPMREIQAWNRSCHPGCLLERVQTGHGSPPVL